MSNKISSLVAFSATSDAIWKTVQVSSTVSTGDNVFCDTTLGSFVVTLPANPQVGACIRFVDPTGYWTISPIEIDPQSQLLDGSHNVGVFSGTDFTLIFVGGSIGWQRLFIDSTLGTSLRSAASASAAQALLGLEGLATQSPSGITVTGGTIDGTPIGATTPASGAFTSLTVPATPLTDNSTNVATTSFVYGIARGNWQTLTSATALTSTSFPANLFANTTSTAFTLTLPASPIDGSRLVVVDPAGSWGTNHLTIDPNGQILVGDSTVLVCDAPSYRLDLIFKTGIGWSISGTKLS